MSRGPRAPLDSSGYLLLADALYRLSVISTDRPDRTPGYPLFLLACRAIASPLGVNAITVTLVIQCLLLAGGVTYLAYRLGATVTGRRATGVLAAVIVATDIELQAFASYILTEALSITLAMLAVWLAVRDGHWRRATWAMAALVLVRPSFVALPLGYAVLDGIRLRRLRAVLEPLVPSVIAVTAWAAVATLGGAEPRTAHARAYAVCRFGTVYQFGLWKHLPDGADKAMLRDADAQHKNAYLAAGAVTHVERPWNDGDGWHELDRIADAAIAAAPLEYVRARLSIIPASFTQPLFFPGMTHSGPAGDWTGPLITWLGSYRAIFYASFPLAVALLAGAVWNGWGWPRVAQAFRAVLGPYEILLFASIAAASNGAYEVNRLVVSFRPLHLLTWALVLMRLGDALRSAAWRQRM